MGARPLYPHMDHLVHAAHRKSMCDPGQDGSPQRRAISLLEVVGGSQLSDSICQHAQQQWCYGLNVFMCPKILMLSSHAHHNVLTGGGFGR